MHRPSRGRLGERDMPASASLAVLDSTLLVPSRKASCTLPPGRTKYFHVDVPATATADPHPSMVFRLSRDGGDPVLMASIGQWPVVDLEANEDMVRAHFCAFDAFHADAAVHTLIIPECMTVRPPHATVGGGAVGTRRGVSPAADPRVLPLASPRSNKDGIVRWAVGVHNVSLVKQESCAFTLVVSIGGPKPQGGSRTAARAAAADRQRLVPAAAPPPPPQAPSLAWVDAAGPKRAVPPPPPPSSAVLPPPPPSSAASSTRTSPQAFDTPLDGISEARYAQYDERYGA